MQFKQDPIIIYKPFFSVKPQITQIELYKFYASLGLLLSEILNLYWCNFLHSLTLHFHKLK